MTISRDQETSAEAQVLASKKLLSAHVSGIQFSKTFLSLHGLRGLRLVRQRLRPFAPVWKLGPEFVLVTQVYGKFNLFIVKHTENLTIAILFHDRFLQLSTCVHDELDAKREAPVVNSSISSCL